MQRRTFLRLGTAGAVMGSAGCLEQLGFERQPAREPPVLEDRPDAVYIPTHVEGMEMIGMAEAGPYQCALSYSFPHRFWLVTGQDRERVDVESDDSVHLMASVWDRETRTVLPTSDVSLTVLRDGETEVQKPPWPMLSQNMGLHLGDNVALPGDGTYEVEIGISPLGTRTTGAFRDRFDDRATASFTYEFSQSALDELSFEQLEDTQGQRGAVNPMEMEMVPLSRLPPPEELPGRTLGEEESGDGRFVVVALDEPPAGVDGSGEYLAVSARTPYEGRYPLPFMSLPATLTRDGETVFDDSLIEALDSELNHHYGAAVDELRAGDKLELSVGAPPQVARHEGYETAFFDFEPMTFEVP